MLLSRRVSRKQAGGSANRCNDLLEESSLSSLGSSTSCQEEPNFSSSLDGQCAAVDILPHMFVESLTTRRDLRSLMETQLERFWIDLPFNCLLFDNDEEGLCGFIGGKMMFALDYDWLLEGGRMMDQDSRSCQSFVADPAGRLYSFNTFQVRAVLCPLLEATEEEGKELDVKLKELKRTLKKDTVLYASNNGELVLARTALDITLLEDARFADFDNMLDDFIEQAGSCRKFLKDANKTARRKSRKRSSKNSFLRRLVATRAATK